MKTKWISIRRLKAHEFETTFRKIYPNDNGMWMQKLEMLGELEQKATSHLLKLLAQILVAYFILTSLRTEHVVSITVFQISASVPVAYFLPVVSLIFFISATAFNHLIVALSLRIGHCNRVVLPGFSVEVLRQIKGHSDISLGIPLITNSFIKEKFPFSVIVSIALLIVILALVIPFMVFGAYILREQWHIALSESFGLLERASCAFGAISMTLTFLYLAIFHIPLPTTKNSFAIRWGVLAGSQTISQHPRIEEWLNEDE